MTVFACNLIILLLKINSCLFWAGECIRLCSVMNRAFTELAVQYAEKVSPTSLKEKAEGKDKTYYLRKSKSKASIHKQLWPTL